MRPLRTLVLWSVPLALAALTGCGSPTNKPSAGGPRVEMPKVAFVSNNPDPFWNIVESGCNKGAAEAGVEIIFKKPSSGSAAEQKEIIDGLVGQGIKAISISVIDPKNQTADLDGVAAKVPLLAVDNDAPESKRKCYIGTDNYAAGRAAGKLVKEALPEGGVVAIFVGQLEALNARQRCRGVLDELADKPAPADAADPAANPGNETQFGKYKLHKIYTDQPEGEPACKQKATDALLDPALNNEANVCLVGLWAYNPPAILSAVKDQKKAGKVKIVGFDENPATLQGVEDGLISATVVQDPFGFGYEAVKLMAELAQGKAYTGPALKPVAHRIITKAGGDGRLTVAAYKAEEARKLGKTQR